MIKTTYTFLIFILIVSLTVACKQKATEQKTKENIKKNEVANIPTFLLYGELVPEGYVEEKDSSITKKSGFTIKRVADCEITDQLVDSVKTINLKNELIMNSKYGDNWKQEFEKETNLRLQIPDIN
ncbi:hypothetical protein [Cellulophaga fucicola]|uniref:Lipoprotein n=1 Tax=Cellulophaga fucicola TaxID=76595 RepID=A0A1K1R101_9FLAO|nr:hypothetical protein [Cellulophaga fucicola]SFW65701.1 hypothetical protein SAMN05660313_03166 [Cellulophaga fucicola]